MRIFGIDPGSIRTGYGCVHTDGSRHRLISCGAISTPAGALLPDRLLRIYRALVHLISEAQPDLILAQDLCRVCAIPSGDVEEALDVLGCRAEVLSLDPARLDDVIACVGAVGAATDRFAEAGALMASLRGLP